MVEAYLGDRVRVIDRVDGLQMTDMEGTVIWVSDNQIGVEFDERFDEGHSCNGRGKNGYCRFAYVDEVSIIKNDDDDTFEDISPELVEFISAFGKQ
jgi:hypothetical protein